jgi:hypothetical protein
MTTESNVPSTDTEQEAAGTPPHVDAETPVHTDGKSPDKMDELAKRAARKGIDRLHRGDANIFTK